MFCWEHASELAKLKPQFDEAGVVLAVVAVGTPEGAQKFADALPFPAENLYVDPERNAYRALSFHGDLDGSEGIFFDPKVIEGVKRLFFTKVTGERIKERGLMTPEGREKMKAVMKNFEVIAPPQPRDAVQQGGTAVFKGNELVYLRADEATADHAPVAEVMAAAECPECTI